MKMTVNYEWLCDLVPNLNQHTPEEIGLALTAVGAETEDISLLEYGKTCLLGKIIKIEKLSKLSKVIVQTKSGDFNIVSNSPNLLLNEYVIFAPIDSKIFGDVIVKAKEIEGVQTQGLLLALENLGIESKSSDICLLGQDEKAAQIAFDVYCNSDAIYTLDVPGNRPDWLSVRELARALAISFDLDLKEYQHSFPSNDPTDFSIDIQSDRCQRYSLAKISNIQLIETPALLKKRLCLLGMRPINYIVDISNVIMLELGQPTHAFDVQKIKGSIIVRQAKEGEKLTLLDNTEITLTVDDLLICDEEKILALAGIMGGLDSGVTESTTEIYLESASFHGTWIRRSAKRLGIKTESSLRFEKNVSPQLVPQAQEFVAATINADITSSTISKQKDIYPNPIVPSQIQLSAEEVNQYLGTDIDADFMKKIIVKLDCELDDSSEKWQIKSLRQDLRIKEDIFEEIARFYGYNNIPSTSYRPSAVQLNPEKTFEEKIRPILRGMGLNEVTTMVFRSLEQQTFYHLENQKSVTIQNPLNSEWTQLRTHLFDGLLDILKTNVNKAFEKKILLSEIASVFQQISKEEFNEEKHFAFLVSEEDGAYQKALNFLNNILGYAKVPSVNIQRSERLSFMHPLNSFEIYIDKQYLGFFGEIHPSILAKLDLSDKKDFPAPIIGELNFNILKEYADNKAQTSNINELPPLFRDITLTVDEDALGINIIEDLKKQNSLIKDIEFISLFQNDALKSEKKKSVSLRIRFESTQSINAQEIDDFIKKMLKH